MSRSRIRKRRAVLALVRMAEEHPIEYERLVEDGDLRQDMTDLADVFAETGALGV